MTEKEIVDIFNVEFLAYNLYNLKRWEENEELRNKEIDDMILVLNSIMKKMDIRFSFQKFNIVK